MIYAGVDEAALGPVLGPFCACCVVLSAGQPKKSPGIIEDKAAGLFLTDSKKIYSKSKGIKILEQNVLAVLKCLDGSFPETAAGFVESAASEYEGWKSRPWFAGFDALTIPRKADPEKIDKLADLLQEKLENEGFRLESVSALTVSAAEFNASLDLTGNKSNTVRDLIKPLFGRIKRSPETAEIITDCQGGRRYYSDWLAAVFSGMDFGETVNNKASIYNSEKLRISFEIKADAHYLHVAMASMTAKYLRELFMEQFNSYWTDKLPGLVPTAGYPQDGKRFIAELNQHGLLPGNRDKFVRKK